MRKLNVGDEVFVTGKIHVLRDATHKRIFEENRKPPVSLKGTIVFHAAPSYRKENNTYKIISIGSTTSMRMEKYTPRLIKEYGVKAIIGKGGMGRETTRAMREHGAVYLLYPGGCSALATSFIKRVEKVYWEDLYGEALWEIFVEDFGPMIVGIDSHGNNIFDQVSIDARKRASQFLGAKIDL